MQFAKPLLEGAAWHILDHNLHTICGLHLKPFYYSTTSNPPPHPRYICYRCTRRWEKLHQQVLKLKEDD